LQDDGSGELSVEVECKLKFILDFVIFKNPKIQKLNPLSVSLFLFLFLFLPTTP